MSPTAQKLLQIEDLVLHFKTNSGTVQAVDRVDFELDSNRAVVILGEQELAAGRAAVRDMTARDQQPVPLDQVVDHVRRVTGGGAP